MSLSNQLTPGDLITFIGLLFAAFAFLSSYLSFPKNFLVHLKDSEIVKCNDQGESYNKILKYFFVMDFVTAWILVFLIFSVLIIIGFLIVKFQLAGHVDPFYSCLKWYISVISIIYLATMILVIHRTNTIRKNYWNASSRKKWIGSFGVLVFIHSIIFICLSSPCFNIRLEWIIIFLLFFLAFLFCILIFLLAHFNPLTELAKYKRLMPKSD
jgi:hypothetical protein